MTENVLLTISGLQCDTDITTKTVAQARYFQKNGSCYLLYEEMLEGFSKPFKSRIKIKPGIMELQRQHAAHMVFEEGKPHVTNYTTPYGELILDIITQKVQIEDKGSTLQVLVEYTLETQGAPLSDYRLEILVEEMKE